MIARPVMFQPPLVFRSTVVALLLASIPLAALGQPDNATTLDGTIPGTDLAVTVIEGSWEPKSIGSYAIRLYTPHATDWPYDAFAHGLVRERDGFVARLLFENVEGNGLAEIVVIVQSAGSGGYLSADAYAVRGGNRFALIAHVDGGRRAMRTGLKRCVGRLTGAAWASEARLTGSLRTAHPYPRPTGFGRGADDS